MANRWVELKTRYATDLAAAGTPRLAAGIVTTGASGTSRPAVVLAIVKSAGVLVAPLTDCSGGHVANPPALAAG